MTKRDRYLIIIIIILVTIISVVFIFNIINIIKNIEGDPKNLVYIGKTNNNLDYSVYIKPNPYIEKNILTKNNSYVTSLIDYIMFKFNYEYNIDRKTNIDYSYFIKGTVIGLYPGEGNALVINPVLTKEYILLPETTKTTVNKNIKIVENLKLELTAYNDLITNFIDDYGIPLNSTLEIQLIINYSGIINKEHYMMASIPLGVKAFDITTSTNFLDVENVYLVPPPKKETSYMKIIIYIIIDFILIGISTYVIKKVIDKYHSKYLLQKNKILKDYEDRIIHVTNFIKYENREIVEIKNFDELLNLSDETFEPIFYWERKVHRNKETWFCILRDTVLYRYILYKNEYIK